MASTQPETLFGNVVLAVNPKVIEPLVSKQLFVSMEPLAEKALKAVEKGELTIIPERLDKTLWWGHWIPVWYIVGKDNEEEYIVARNDDEALEKGHERYGKDVKLYQDPDVLDTWFSSALWPFNTLGWPDLPAEDFKRFYPTTMLEKGYVPPLASAPRHDIPFFWAARMVMMGFGIAGTVPFSYVYLHGLIKDSQTTLLYRS